MNEATERGLQEVTTAVSQAMEQQALGESTQPQTTAEEGPAFDAAASEFLACLKGYRHYSPWTVRAYATRSRVGAVVIEAAMDARRATPTAPSL